MFASQVFFIMQKAFSFVWAVKEKGKGTKKTKDVRILTGNHTHVACMNEQYTVYLHAGIFYC